MALSLLPLLLSFLFSEVTSEATFDWFLVSFISGGKRRMRTYGRALTQASVLRSLLQPETCFSPSIPLLQRLHEFWLVDLPQE
jgi:hypothetical protein